MKQYGIIIIGMAVLSVVMAIVQHPGWLIGGAFSYYLAGQFIYDAWSKRGCSEITKGRVISIRANGTFVGGHHQPLHNAQIAYLDSIKEFTKLPPNFVHDVSPGDLIEIKYNAKKPDVAFVNFIE